MGRVPQLWLFALLALLGGCASDGGRDQPGAASVREAALQGDLRKVLAALRAPGSAGAGLPADQAACIRARLDPPAWAPGAAQDMADGAAAGASDASRRALAALSPDALAVLAAFEAYWRGLLLQEQGLDQAENDLLQGIGVMSVGRQPNVFITPDAAANSVLLRRTLAGTLDALPQATAKTQPNGMPVQEGVHAFIGTSRGLIDLLLWRSDEVRSYVVALPDGNVSVMVTLMKEVAVHGWLGWATCGIDADRAWASAGELHVLADQFDVDADAFRAGQLGYYGQRQWDSAQLPMLEPAELEYRASLAVLARSANNGYAQSWLKEQLALAANGRGEPRRHAAYWLMRQLGKQLFNASDIAADDARWRGQSAATLSAAARTLLLASTQQVRAATARSELGGGPPVGYFLPD